MPPSTSHYLLDVDLFSALQDRLPLRTSVCGHTLTFGHPALRAVGSFVEVQARTRAGAESTGPP